MFSPDAAVVGMDVHRRFSRFTVRDQQQHIIQRGRLDHRDRRRLRHDLATLSPHTPVVLEASFGWAWLADELLQVGSQPMLASARKLDGWRKARGLVKTDRLDADLLSTLPAERHDWWRVWLVPPAVRDRRELMRHRADLVGQQTDVKNRIHSLMHRAGIWHDFTDLFGCAGRRFCQQLVDDRAQLSDAQRQVLRAMLSELDDVRRRVARATRQVGQFIAPEPAVQRLQTIPGIGRVLAGTLVAEIGQIERFASAKQLASYCMLAPRAHESGVDSPNARPSGRRVAVVGRRTLTWAMIEAAHGAVRSGGGWRAFWDARSDGGKRDRNRAYIATARKLSNVVYVCWRKDCAYSPAPPARPGVQRHTPSGAGSA